MGVVHADVVGQKRNGKLRFLPTGRETSLQYSNGTGTRYYYFYYSSGTFCDMPTAYRAWVQEQSNKSRIINSSPRGKSLTFGTTYSHV